MEQMSDQIGDLAKALAKAQSELDPATKNASNPFLKNKYADLQACIAACKSVLPKNGLSYAQCIVPSEVNTVCVETVLMHESGQWIKGRCTLPCQIQTNRDGKQAMNPAQATGSAITYARRYGLSAIVGLATEDDDADSAAPYPSKDQRKQEKQAVQKVRENASENNPEHPNKTQLSAMFASMKGYMEKLGLNPDDRDANLTELSAIVGHPIKSSLDLTQDEYQKVMRAIDGLGNEVDEPF